MFASAFGLVSLASTLRARRTNTDPDNWLKDNLDGYLQWAKSHNSLLIVTTESGVRDGTFAAGGTTVVNGDPRLFVSGVNNSFVTLYNMLRTVEAMYGVAPIGDSATAAILDTNAQGKLSPGGPVAVTLVAGQSATYTATVSPVAPAAGMPSGTIQFMLDGRPFGAPVTLTNGSASVSLGNLSAGSHPISAAYAGDGSFSGGGGAAGKATFATAALAVGSHSITALYSGDANFSGSLSGAVTQQVLALPTPTDPANDKFANRVTLTGATAITTGTNVGATKEAGEPKRGGNVGGKSVWWSWKAIKSAVVTIETLGSTFKTFLGVYTGSSLATLQKVTGVPLAVRGAATFTFVARAGQTYQIAVDGADGNINLAVRSRNVPGGGGNNDNNTDTNKDDKRRKKSKAKRKQ